MAPGAEEPEQLLECLRRKYGMKMVDTDALTLLAIAELPKGRQFEDLLRRTGMARATQAWTLVRLRERGEIVKEAGHRGFHQLTPKGNEVVEKLLRQ